MAEDVEMATVLQQQLSEAAQTPVGELMVPQEKGIPDVRFHEAAGRIVDFRTLFKPGGFSGKDADWLEWKQRFLAMSSMLDSDQILKKVEQCSMDVVLELERQFPARCKFFFSTLFALMQGRAQAYVRDPGLQQSGWRAWRKLIEEFEPDLPTRRMSLLAGLLQVQFSAEKFDEELMAWERKVTAYEMLTSTVLPHDLKCAIVFQGSPTRIFEIITLPENYNHASRKDRGVHWTVCRAPRGGARCPLEVLSGAPGEGKQGAP